MEAHSFLAKTVEEMTVGATTFRVWGEDEEPQTFMMELYLNADYDGLTLEQVVDLLVTLNPDMPSDYSIESCQDQFDKGNTPRGRLLFIHAGLEFYSFCKANGFELELTGDRVPCITQEDKTRLNLQKRRNPNNNNNNHREGRHDDKSVPKKSKK
jgi:hypothetical protein